MAASTVTTNAVDNGIVPDKLGAGTVLCRSAKYTATASLDADSVLQMVPVCDGMMILDVQVFTSALGTSVTLDIGDGDDVDRFFDGVDASSACAMDLANEGDLATCINHVYGADDTIDVKVLGAAFPDGGVVVMNVFYKMVESIEDEQDTFG